MLGGIEAGGTKFVCGVGTGPGDLKTATFRTTTPEETIPEVIEFFQKQGAIQALGIGSFGPVDLREGSKSFGFITSTPKRGWGNYDLKGSIQRALKVPVQFDTDVNAAIRGEVRWGGALGLTDAVYMTIGTGIGGGAIAHGRVVHGLVHPEMGHLRLPHDRERDPFPGICPYHGDCLEGLACGPALQARWGKPATELGEGHEAWALEAHYLGLALVNILLTLSPQRIVLGGGVMQNQFLFPIIRAEVVRMLGGYVRDPSILERVDEFIVPPRLGNDVGVLGALALAEAALERAA
jgi:fructokinase